LLFNETLLNTYFQNFISYSSKKIDKLTWNWFYLALYTQRFQINDPSMRQKSFSLTPFSGATNVSWRMWRRQKAKIIPAQQRNGERVLATEPKVRTYIRAVGGGGNNAAAFSYKHTHTHASFLWS